MRYSLRSLSPGDAPALLEVFNQPLCRQAMDMEPFESAQALETWLVGTGNGNVQTVVTVDDTPIAFAGLFLDRGTERGTGWISLFVHDAHHRRGVGALLMTALIATAHGFGIPKIKLIVLSDNQRAIALYRRFGFRIEIRDDAYLQRDGATLPAFTMARITRAAYVSPPDRPKDLRGRERADCPEGPPRPADRAPDRP